MRSLILLLILLSPVFAQKADDKPKPDRWRGLAIDVATPEDAIAKLGKPESDKIDSVRVYEINKWYTSDLGKKIYRKLAFKDVAGVSKAELSFRDNKLIVIELHFDKKFPPNSLENSYGIEFKPHFGGLEGSARSRYNNSRAIVFPASYFMIGKSETSVVCALVNNGVGSAFKTMGGVTDGEGNFPGKVTMLQIVSESLRNKDGADVLK